MPGDVTGGDCFLHPSTLFGRCLLEVFVKQPRACGPDIALVSRLPQLAGKIHRPGEVFFEIAVNHSRLGVDEAGIEMTLEHHQDALNPGIRRRYSRRGLEDQRCDRVLFQHDFCRKQSLINLNCPCSPEVCEYEDSLAVRILYRDMSQIGCLALGFESPRSSANRTGKVCQGPILPTADHFLSMSIDD